MFPCDRCGICCRHIGDVPWARGMALPGGICRYLDQETNLCTIYARRPLFCNVDAYYEAYMKERMSREEFYRLNGLGCRELKAKYGKPEKYLQGKNTPS